MTIGMTAVVLDQPPFSDEADAQWGGTLWPAHWVCVPGLPAGPVDVWYRLRFTLNEASNTRIHVSADERYDLMLDGQRVGRGPHRGDLRHWCFESYDLELPAGEHTLQAWVSSPGEENRLAPSAHLSRAHGFVLAAEGEAADQLNTGRAAWEAAVIPGVTHLPPQIPEARFAGGTQRIDGRRFDWDKAAAEGKGWQPVVVDERAQHGGEPYGELSQVRPLVPTRLPAMMERPITAGRVRHVTDTPEGPVRAEEHRGDEAAAWQGLLLEKRCVEAGPNQTRSVLIDLEDYFCAYPRIEVSGGADAQIDLDWAEALFVEPRPDAAKANRDQIEGLHFVGRGDQFVADGGERAFDPVWWRAGRYVRLTVRTADEPLVIRGLRWRETRYPLELMPMPEIGDERLSRALPVMERGLLMCMHESYMDTPYYEQLMYVGDTRLDALCTFIRSPDDRLPRRAIELYGQSRMLDGLVQARYPSTTPQLIPSFSLWWVSMLHDLALWRGQKKFVHNQMPAARSVLETFRSYLDEDGLYRSMSGWNFLDWVPGWSQGVPPEGREGVNASFNWQLVYTLRQKAELEAWLGEDGLAQRDREAAECLAKAIDKYFWDDSRGLFADDLGRSRYSQHAQCLAVLSGVLPPARSASLVQNMLASEDLAPTTIYFTHYLFEALAAVGDAGAISERLELWRGLPEMGFVSLPESPEPSRSDCHAWGCHPLYHLVASVIGLRPATFGFDEVVVRPHLGPWPHASAAVPHPRGTIEAHVETAGEGLRAGIVLPHNVSGQLEWGGRSQALKPGNNTVCLSPA